MLGGVDELYSAVQFMLSLKIYFKSFHSSFPLKVDQVQHPPSWKPRLLRALRPEQQQRRARGDLALGLGGFGWVPPDGR